MTDSTKKPQQNMANSPAELLKILADISFMKPDELSQKMRSLHETHFHTLDMEETPRPYIENDAADIRAADIEHFAMQLVDISKQSREDGNILWGRIQGTKYEAQAQALVADTLRSYGIEDVRQDFFPIRFPQWNPTKNELTITQSNEFEAPLTFENAITPFPSGVTDEFGIEAEIVYVGQGTSAELQGRNLEGKIVLLQADFSAGGPMYSSARTAYSRIASGIYGNPAGLLLGGRFLAPNKLQHASVLWAVVILLAQQSLGSLLAMMMAYTYASCWIVQPQKSQLKRKCAFKATWKMARLVSLVTFMVSFRVQQVNPSL